jgi:hypothetical protein
MMNAKRRANARFIACGARKAEPKNERPATIGRRPSSALRA